MWHVTRDNLYDEASGPRRPFTRRPTREWDDPYRDSDMRVSIQTLPPLRRPRPSSLWPIPEIAQMRREGVTFRQIRELVGFSTDSVKAWLAEADFDEWGWRPTMYQNCRRCGRSYSPFYRRTISVRASWSTWPSAACSTGCARALGVPNPQG